MLKVILLLPADSPNMVTSSAFPPKLPIFSLMFGFDQLFSKNEILLKEFLTSTSISKREKVDPLDQSPKNTHYFV